MKPIVEVDSITLSVISHSLTQITNEMDLGLARTAFTPVISEGQDRADGIYSREGEVIAQGDSSLPVFMSTMQDAVQATLRELGQLEAGDIAILNDPYLAGTHLMDMRLVRPFYHQRELLFHLANTGHWTDVGGMSPGGFCVAAREVQQEGLRIPPILIMREGRLLRDVVRLIMSNLRIPSNAEGDLHAQLAALSIGERRLTEVLAKYGPATIMAAVDQLRVRGERAMRARIGEIPDGKYVGESSLDNDGVDPEPLTVHVDITVTGEVLSCDFSRSTGWVRGPFNTTLPTTKAGVYIALKHLFPDVPTNAGCFEPVTVVAPETTFLNAGYPKAVSGSSAEVSAAVTDAVMHALAEALPERVPAGCYRTMAAFTLGGHDPILNRPYILYAFNGGGYGANPEEDGLTNAPMSIGIAKAPPIEITEQQYPVLYEYAAIRQDSGGPGTRRGGMGVEQEISLLRGEAALACLMNNGSFAPWGAAGGGDGALTELSFVLNGETFFPPLKTKVDGIVMQAGDRIRIKTPGGGGWGPPEERDEQLIERDLRLGYCSPEAVARDYGARTTRGPLKGPVKR